MPIDWRIVPGFANYEISDEGQVRRLTTSANGQHQAGMLLAASSNGGKGYRYVDLWGSDGARRKCGVHVLLLEAFVGPKPSANYEAAHKDGCKRNNTLGNLRWATHSANELDKRRYVRQRQRYESSKPHTRNLHSSHNGTDSVRKESEAQ